LTDLNLGHVYYYGTGEDGKRPYLQRQRPQLLLKGLQNSGEPGVAVRPKAKPELAEELQRELEEMHGRELPKSTGLIYKRWSDPFFGAGWHTWNPGSRPREAPKRWSNPGPARSSAARSFPLPKAGWKAPCRPPSECWSASSFAFPGPAGSCLIGWADSLIGNRNKKAPAFALGLS